MAVSGERIKTTRWVHSGQCFVAGEVEMGIPVDDLSEPCHGSETVGCFKEIEEHARKGDVGWLKRAGMVYEAVDAA